MTPTRRHLGEIAACLRVRGRRRRRILAECASHLDEAAAVRGETAAVASFGPAAEIAAALDLEAAAARGATSTAMSAAGVALTALSTLVLINAAGPGAEAPPVLALAVLLAGQIAGVAAATAVLQALAQRRGSPPAAALALLARRNATGLAAAAATIVAAGAALTGQAPAPLLLAGPLALVAALAAVGRAWRLAGALPGGRDPIALSPIADLASLAGIRVPARLGTIDPLRHAVPSATLVAALAATAMFARALREGDAAGTACALAALEATGVVGCFVLLGPALGLRRARRDREAL